jgi:hypothetical protein
MVIGGGGVVARAEMLASGVGEEGVGVVCVPLHADVRTTRRMVRRRSVFLFITGTIVEIVYSRTTLHSQIGN